MTETVTKALQVIEKDHPEAFETLTNMVNKNVISLGTDEAFALRDGTGEIRAFKQRLELSAQNSGLIQPVYDGPFVISAQGYEMWAESAGASVIFPRDVVVGNEMMANPYAERDKTNGRILCVHARAIAFRFTSKGIPQVSDWTTMFDTPSYRFIDLLAKAKKTPQAFKLLPTSMEPESKKGATWAPYAFDESTRLWVNTAHPDALKWYSQIINREKKSIDFAQTFAKRNALKHLSGLQKSPANTWQLTVLCWRPLSGNIIKWDATQYAALQDRVAGMIESGGGSEFEGKAPMIESGKERTSDEEGYEGIEAETDPEDQPAIDVEGETVETTTEPDHTAEPEKESPEGLPEEDEKVLINYDECKESFTEEFSAAVKDVGVKDRDKPTVDEARAVIAYINNLFN